MIYFSSEVHYFNHLYPIWQATPDLPFYVTRHIETHAARFIPTDNLRIWPLPRTREEPAIVASYQDYLSTRNRPCIFVEHGAGQAYNGVDSGSYSGGSGRDRAIAFLVPHPTVAARNTARYPSTPNHVIGSPYLSYLSSRRNHPVTGLQSHTNLPRVGISFHWNCDVAPEALSAYDHYKPILRDLNNDPDYSLVGHAHPKATWLPEAYYFLDIPYEPSWIDLATYIDLLVVDNSSILYEAAALDIPVIALNAPWYRKHIHHGLRFWSDIPGPQCDDPSQLPDLIHHWLKPQPNIRQYITSKVYSPTIDRDALAMIIRSYG